MDLSNGNFPPETMNMSEDSKAVKPQKKSVKSYASGVFQESTIGMVASIITTDSRVRKSFKTILLILCISGFLYQCITHLVHVYEYPTVVGLDIKRPETYNIPGFTFCNNNGMKRSVFCTKYPDRCFESNEKFCHKYPKYCDGNKTFVPKKEYYNVEDTMTYDEILKHGDNIEEFLLFNRSTFDDEYRSVPLLRFKGDGSNAMVCYSLYSVVEKLRTNSTELEPKKPDINTLPIKKEPAHILIFHVDEKEMFVPGNHPGILLSINSPYLSVNPFEKGLFLKPGRAYKIYISMQEEKLLEPPYETNCLDYVKMWETNNRTGPRIQEMCQRKCWADLIYKCLNCSAPYLLYPSQGRKCTEEDEVKFSTCEVFTDPMAFIEDFKCSENCKDDCRLTKYNYEVLEMYDVDYGDDQDDEEEERLITVHIYYEDGEVITMKHAPKYTSVEVFSAIGGFSGVWLGISFMDIFDAVGSAFLISRYAAKNRKKL